ncbi:anthocyanidin 3-O-glucosyltransferase 6-like [Vicia villosa]|uniref:anthocyanidin 3-O-glucosyltransferase 6-like n=1 Tax=Vicia villosa TaxID=3911 RepID=UPI00273B9A3A|nr:anthocyanidin 3-O-glucosyltransferase 6-like [Vicia villosa]
MKKAEVVFIPLPVPSHIVSTLEFANLLINRENRLRITILLMKLPHSSETDVYTKSLPITDSLNIINLPECSLPPNTAPPSAMNALIEAQKPNVKQAVANLTAERGETGVLAAFVVDMFCTNMIDVAKEFSVPTLVFFTSGAASLGLNIHLHTLRERDIVDVNRLQELTELEIPSFENSVPLYSFPDFVVSKKWEAFFMDYYVRGLKKADGIIVNSFEELESYAVHSFASHPDLASLTTIYPVGPILTLESISVDSNDIIKWLDDQPLSSVVFICFGTRGSFDEDQVNEIAHAIEKSEARFVWSLRKPQPKGDMAMPSDYSISDLVKLLPEGFLDRTKEIGRVVGWAPQTQILAHPATGGFVSHCGWNSILESVYFGVPIATWPLFAEQQTNAFQLVRELKMAVEIALDYKVELMGGPNYLLTADKIEKGIRNVLDIDGEFRKKVKEMSEKSRKTMLEGGSSYTYLGRLIDYIVNQI